MTGRLAGPHDVFDQLNRMFGPFPENVISLELKIDSFNTSPYITLKTQALFTDKPVEKHFTISEVRSRPTGVTLDGNGNTIRRTP